MTRHVALRTRRVKGSRRHRLHARYEGHRYERVYTEKGMELSEASLENVSRNLGELQDGVRTKQAKFLASASLGCTRAKKAARTGPFT